MKFLSLMWTDEKKIPRERSVPGTVVLETGSLKVPIVLERCKGRKLRILVLTDGRVRASVPRGVGPEQVLAFARKKALWIERAIRKSENSVRLFPPATAMETGRISFLGHPLPVKIELGRGRRASLKEGVLVVPVADLDDNETVRRRLEAWLKLQAGLAFEPVLRRGLGAAALQGVPDPTWSLRRMKRRWGSCRRDGRIVFNIGLVQTPPPLIEYVVLHELCHLKHHDHGAAFYSLLGKCLPDWKERRRELNRIALD